MKNLKNQTLILNFLIEVFKIYNSYLNYKKISFVNWNLELDIKKV